MIWPYTDRADDNHPVSSFSSGASFFKKEVSSINTGISALQVRGLPMDLVGAGHRSMCEASSQLSYGGIIKVIK